MAGFAQPIPLPTSPLKGEVSTVPRVARVTMPLPRPPRVLRRLSPVDGKERLGVQCFILFGAYLTAPFAKPLPLQGGGREGDGYIRRILPTHPHPSPPLEGEGIMSQQSRSATLA
jgi:hypothetical protein